MRLLKKAYNISENRLFEKIIIRVQCIKMLIFWKSQALKMFRTILSLKISRLKKNLKDYLI